MTFHVSESSMCTRSFLHPFFRCQGLRTHCAGPDFVLGSSRIRRKEAGMNSARSPPKIEFLLIQKFDLTEENKMKYAPRKVFIKENGEYIPLWYADFCRLKKENKDFEKKRFVPVQGCLLEVDENTYKDIYREYERNRYVQKLERENTVCRADAIGNNEAASTDNATSRDDLENQVINRVMIEKLVSALGQLEPEESVIIDLVYYKGMSKRSAAELIGFTQSTMEYKVKKLIRKLKAIMEE